LARGGIFYDIPGRTREEVLEAVSKLSGIPPGVDRRLLYQLLVCREALASTGVGEGIAMPHPRDPVVVRVDEPVVLLCFLAQPVDFGAVDGEPVRVLFTLLSPTVSSHLQMLSRLSFVLHDAVLRGMLRGKASAEDLLGQLAAGEAASLASRPAPDPGAAGESAPQ
jgi:PTS system nitrogen regulatory IIA component